MNTKEAVLAFFAGLAVLVAFLGVIAAFYFTGQGNATKDRQLTTVCVQHGYTGWSYERGCFR